MSIYEEVKGLDPRNINYCVHRCRYVVDMYGWMRSSHCTIPLATATVRLYLVLYIFYIYGRYRIYTGYESKGAFIFEPLFLDTRYFALSRRFLNILGLPRTMSFAIKMPTS